MFCFVSGGYSHTLQKTERRRNTSASTATRGCVFVATTSGYVGRCTVQPELSTSNDSTQCVPDKEAGDEERSMEDVTTMV